MLHAVVTGQKSGLPLTDNGIADLHDCYKVYFNTLQERERGENPWRIVYQKRFRGEGRPPIVHIVAIGARPNLVVYTTAAQRLGRSVGYGKDQPLSRAAAAGLSSPSGKDATPEAAAGRASRVAGSTPSVGRAPLPRGRRGIR
ncbi:hypothetical protein GCM10010156_66200 [Planobispora rosea]|uniref:Uncharacterized protein n=2 Tax=Planobispora rosea TaxID=35762 RepID=A0A8J3SAA0_PLARO|nr:hypothetical protein GCM10010156_66200 [Planobispora rosea]GIH87984.1 hypothetical protein Pro02_63920 [Planobispora rosea]